jgi:hypothetical protein
MRVLTNAPAYLGSSVTADTSGRKRETVTDDVRDVVRGAFEAQAADVAERFGSVFETHHDQSESVVLAALKGACAEIEWEPTDEFLRPYAKAITAGRQVVVEYGRRQSG